MTLRRKCSFEITVRLLGNFASMNSPCKLKFIQISEFFICEKILDFTLVLSSDMVSSYSKMSSRQSIRGHLMKLKQFNYPVHCALCHESIRYCSSFVIISFPVILFV